MKNFMLLILSVFLFSFTAHAAGRDDGLSALNRQDYKTAFLCFQEAAASKDAEAQYRLGMLYEKGQGVRQDYDKAAYWYKKAVKQDHVLAQNALGFLYYNGKGVPRDLVISLALFNIAAARGNADAFQNTYIAASNISFKNFDRAKHLSSHRKKLYAMIDG